MATNSPAGNGPVDRRVGRLLLRCPKCGRSQDTDRQKHDYQEAVRLEIVCPKCDDGDFHEPFYYDAQGKHIFRDPDEPPNAEVSGAGTASAGLPGYAGDDSDRAEERDLMIELMRDKCRKVGVGDTALDIHADLTLSALRREIAK